VRRKLRQETVAHAATRRRDDWNPSVPGWRDPYCRRGIIDALHRLIQPGDLIVLEGDNQKQADFLSRSLAKCDPKRLHELHLVISSISRPEHLTLFELGLAKKVDFAFAGLQSLRVAQLLEDGVLGPG
jgi:malonate decarboxylase alpha subunit